MLLVKATELLFLLALKVKVTGECVFYTHGVAGVGTGKALRAMWPEDSVLEVCDNHMGMSAGAVRGEG